MINRLNIIGCASILILIAVNPSTAQDRELESQQFRQAERIIRVAETGDLADTLNVWGDINSPGRYLVPTSTNLPELISYSFGPSNFQNREAALDWTKLRMEIKISRFDEDGQDVTVDRFQYRYDENEPQELFDYDLENNDIVTIQVKRKPAFADYVGVIAPVISSVATGFLIIERLR